MAWIRLEIDGAEILFSDRTGGVSAPPFDTANAGYARGDDPANVDENRGRIGAAFGGPSSDPAKWICLHQVHGARVYLPDVAGPTAGRPAPEADAAVSTGSDAILSVLTADCAPVALVAPGVVGAVHAGWRGVLAGVLEAAVAEVRRRSDGPLNPGVGPGKQPEGDEVSAHPRERNPRNTALTRPHPPPDWRAACNTASISAGRWA